MRHLASILVALFALYVGAYFFFARPGVTITVGGWHTSCPDYQWLSVLGVDAAFSPLHQFDRRHLRPTLWAKPMTLAERRQIADLVAHYVSEALPPNPSAPGKGGVSLSRQADRALPALPEQRR